MTSVTIHDEATRRVVEYALWYRASDFVGDTLEQSLWDAGWETIGLARDGVEGSEDRAAEQLEGVLRARSDIEAVRRTASGATTEIGTPVAELLPGFESCRDEVAADLFNGRRTEREALLATRDAAERLLAELAPVGAVA